MVVEQNLYPIPVMTGTTIYIYNGEYKYNHVMEGWFPRRREYGRYTNHMFVEHLSLMTPGCICYYIRRQMRKQ